MCKYCDTKFYFDFYYYQPDGGYGDDDIEELEKNEVFNLFCCPVCGKIKPDAIKKYGSLERALEVLLYNNLKDFNIDNYNRIIDNFKLSDMYELQEFLSLNNLYLENNILYHKCGKEIIKLKESISILSIKKLIKSLDIHFCSKCGDKIQPLQDIVIVEEKMDEPLSFVVERQRIK